MMRSILPRFFAALLLAGAAAVVSPAVSEPSQSKTAISRRASESCARKVKMLEEFSAKEQPRGNQTTRLSEEEINSFLAYELSKEYHPCLKSLEFKLQEGPLQATAVVDFDRLAMTSKQFFAKLIASLFRGSHTLTMRGKIIAQEGKAHFELEEAAFDGTGLPNLLVEEVISTVGKRQKPPFDPLQPSEMPYGVQKVEFHNGYVLVYQ